jgi:biopolymer transport protein ExbD
MSGSRRGGRRNSDTAELNITVFMNLMVILVPFLLITAVFSRVAVLELNLPAASSAEAREEQTFQLEITVREAQIEVGDRHLGALGIYPNAADGYDYAALGKKLEEIKRSYPTKTDASILLEADIPYDTLVQVMDRVRVSETITDSSVVRTDLFPDISIGDAPARDGGA